MSHTATSKLRRSTRLLFKGLVFCASFILFTHLAHADTIGDTAILGGTFNEASNCRQVIPSVAGTITSISWYGHAAASGNYSVAVYSDTGNVPNVPLATSGIDTPISTTDAWNTQSISYTFTPNQVLWLCAWSDTTFIQWYYGSSGALWNTSVMTGQTYRTWPTWTQNQVFDLHTSVYATYTPAPADITSNLIAHYTFDEGSGTTAVDSVGGNNAALINGPTYSAGKIGSHAITFDGSSSYAVTGGNLNTGSTFTVSAWFKPNGAQVAYFRLLDTDFASQFFLGGDPAGTQFNFVVRNDSFAVGGAYSSGTWVHVAATSDPSGGGRLYVNGSLVATGLPTNLVPGSLPLYFGTYDGSPGSNLLKGDLDEVCIYSRALSALDVSTLYNSSTGCSAPAAPVISAIATSTTLTTATITWTTDGNASSTVKYGATSSYGTASSSDTLVTSHSITLTGLTPATTYHYQVGSQGGTSGLVSTSNDATFTTAPSITSNLFGWWKFDEGSGTAAADSSGNGNTGTFSGTTPPSWVAGKVGPYAINNTVGIGGSGGYVSTPNTTSATHQDISWSAWVYPTDLTGQSGFNIFLSGTQYGFEAVNSSGNFLYRDRENNDHVYTGATVPLNAWTMLTATCRDTLGVADVLTMYINGVQVKQDTGGSGNLYCYDNFANQFYIAGNAQAPGSYGWTGYVDDARIYYGRALTSGDAAQLYALGNAAPAAPVISSISVSTTTTTATVTWTTDITASSTVKYGTTSAYGIASSSDSLVTSHSVTLTGLSVSTQYHFQVGSQSGAGLVSTSSDGTFTTAAAITPPNITSIASTTLVTTATVTWTTDTNATSKVAYGTSAGAYTTSSSSPSLVTSHSIGLTGLSAGTRYFYVVVSADAFGNISTSSEKALLTAAAADVTPPVISSIASSTDSLSARITWTTNEAATSSVQYGITSSYGSIAASSTFETSHSVTLTGLAPNTRYHFRVSSGDPSGNYSTSSDLTFTTAVGAITLCGNGSCITIHDGDIIGVVGDSITSIDFYNAYLESYFHLRYPTVHVHFRWAARSGAAIPNYTTGGQYEEDINPLSPNIVILMMTNNGGYSADQYAAQVNDLDNNYIIGMGGATPFFLGPPPANSADGIAILSDYSDKLNTISQANGYAFANVWSYLHTIWALNLASSTPVDIQDGGDADHMGPPAHLGIAYSYISFLNADPNVSSTTIDAASPQVITQSNATISNLTKTASGIDFTRLDDRLPMAYDDRSLPIFKIMPQIYDVNKYMLTVKNLASGYYYVYVDGVPSGSVSSTELDSGWNMSKMTSGPIHDQLEEVLGRIRDKEGLDRITRAADYPQAGMFQYGSNASSCYSDQGLRGAPLKTCLATAIQNLNNLDGLIYAEAQPVARNFSLQKVTGTPDTAPPAISNPLPNTTLPQGTTSTTLSVDTDENATCRYSTVALTDYPLMTNTFTTHGGTTNSVTLTGLVDGPTYTYYIRCEDAHGNHNMTDYTLTFSVAAEPNPILHYAFDEGSGSSAADTSGNGHTGTLINSPSWVAGKVGTHALLFNGSNQAVSAGTISDAGGIGAITISAWVKGAGTFGASSYTLISKYLAGQGSWFMGYSGQSQAYYCVMSTDTSGATALGPGTTLTDTNWHLVSCVYDGSKLTQYTDGVAGSVVNTPALTGIVQNRTYPVCIAGESDGTNCVTNTGDLYAGIVDDVRIYKRALPSGEILNLYQQTPPVISNIATSTTSSTATITWNTDVTASSTVNYGLTSSYGSASTSDPFVMSHSIALTGLQPSTIYHFQVASGGTFAVATSSDLTFTTAAAVDNSPATVTSAASSVSSSTAVLNGSISNTHGFNATQSGFAYGTASDLHIVIATTTLGAQTGTASFSSSVSGLTPNTAYYFRAYASSTQGIGYGSIQSFTTSAVSVPTVTTQAVSSLTDTSAVGNGTITSTGNIDPKVRGFVYGTTSRYGATTTENGDFSTGGFTAAIASLACGTTYHYAAYASSTQGFGYGSDVTFTPTCLSSISNVSISPIASTAATITWTSDEPASSKVDFGIDSSYGTSTPETDTSPRVTSHSVTLSSLLPCTFYHYRVRSRDVAATQVIGSDNTFLTAGCSASAAVSTTTVLDITGSGGTLNARDTNNLGLVLTVPSSFSSSTSQASFQSKQLNASTFLGTITAPSGLKLVGSYLFNLEALSDATTSLHSFDHPLTVSITYTDSDVANFDTNTLTIKRYDGVSWNDLSNCSTDLTAKTVTCSTDRFSDFGLFGAFTPPAASNSAALTSFGGGGGGGTAGLPKSPFQILCWSGICYQVTPATTTAATQTTVPTASTSTLSLKNVFTRTLYLGMSGNDVKQLQIFLNLHGFTVAKTGPGSRGHETMFYGRATQAAVSTFQATYAKIILAPNGFTRPTGTFGVATRAQAIRISLGQN